MVASILSQPTAVHALTFRKLELCPVLPPEPLSWRGSPGGEGPVDGAGSKPGDLASGGERRARFEGCCTVEEAGDFGFMTRCVSMWLSFGRFQPWYDYRTKQ